jgi:hypothetical protein
VPKQYSERRDRSSILWQGDRTDLAMAEQRSRGSPDLGIDGSVAANHEVSDFSLDWLGKVVNRPTKSEYTDW